MAEHGEERRRGHEELLVWPAEQHPRHQNRSQTFGGVKKESRKPERRRLAGHVGGANVAAAARTHILALEDPHQQVTKRDGPQQVANGGRYGVGIPVCRSNPSPCSSPHPPPAAPPDPAPSR